MSTCDVCVVQYPNDKELELHLSSLIHHVKLAQKSDSAVHRCGLCREDYGSITGYSRHLQLARHSKLVNRFKSRNGMTVEDPIESSVNIEDSTISTTTNDITNRRKDTKQKNRDLHSSNQLKPSSNHGDKKRDNISSSKQSDSSERKDDATCRSTARSELKKNNTQSNKGGQSRDNSINSTSSSRSGSVEGKKKKKKNKMKNKQNQQLQQEKPLTNQNQQSTTSTNKNQNQQPKGSTNKNQKGGYPAPHQQSSKHENKVQSQKSWEQGNNGTTEERARVKIGRGGAKSKKSEFRNRSLNREDVDYRVSYRGGAGEEFRSPNRAPKQEGEERNWRDQERRGGEGYSGGRSNESERGGYGSEVDGGGGSYNQAGGFGWHSQCWNQDYPQNWQHPSQWGSSSDAQNWFDDSSWNGGSEQNFRNFEMPYNNWQGGGGDSGFNGGMYGQMMGWDGRGQGGGGRGGHMGGVPRGGNNNWRGRNDWQGGRDGHYSDSGRHTGPMRSESPPTKDGSAQSKSGKNELKGDKKAQTDSEASGSVHTLNLSLKASKIIDDIMKGGTGKDLVSKDAPKAAGPSKLQEPDRSTNLLDKAENLCKELRLKRQLAQREQVRKELRVKEHEKKKLEEKLKAKERELHRSLSKEKSDSTQRNSSRDVSKVSFVSPNDCSSVQDASRLSQGSKVSSSSSSKPLSSIMKGPNTSRARRVSESSDKVDGSADNNIMRLINTPRSRRERMEVARILTKYGKVLQQKQRPRLALNNEQGSGEAELLQLDQLPEELRQEIAQLMDQEMVEDAAIQIPQDPACSMSLYDIIQQQMSPQKTSTPSESTAESTSKPSDNRSATEHAIDSYVFGGIASKSISSVSSAQRSRSTTIDTNPLDSPLGSSLDITDLTSPARPQADRSDQPIVILDRDEEPTTTKDDEDDCMVVEESSRNSVSKDLATNFPSAIVIQPEEPNLMHHHPHSHPLQHQYPPYISHMMQQPYSGAHYSDGHPHPAPPPPPFMSSAYNGPHHHHYYSPARTAESIDTDQSLVELDVSGEGLELIGGGLDGEGRGGGHSSGGTGSSSQDNGGGGRRSPGKRRRTASTTPSPTSSTDPAPVTASPQMEQTAKRQCIDGVGGLVDDGRSPMDHVLEISLKEEEVHNKLSETEHAITSLQELLQKTQTQLSKRLDMKRKLQEEESSLRAKRLAILKGAVSSANSSLNHSTVSIDQPQQAEGDSQLDPTGKDPTPPPPAQQASRLTPPSPSPSPPKPQEAPQQQDEPDTTNQEEQQEDEEEEEDEEEGEKDEEQNETVIEKKVQYLIEMQNSQSPKQEDSELSPIAKSVDGKDGISDVTKVESDDRISKDSKDKIDIVKNQEEKTDTFEVNNVEMPPASTSVPLQGPVTMSSPRKKSHSFCMADSLSRRDGDRSPGEGDMPGPIVKDGVTMQYMGSLGVPGQESNVLQQLAVNFANLRQASYVFLDAGTMQEEKAQLEDKSQLETETEPPTDGKVVEKEVVVQEKTEIKKVKKGGKKSVGKDKSFKKPSVECIRSSPRLQARCSPEIERSRSPIKGGSPSAKSLLVSPKKKRQSRKARDQVSCLPQDSESDSTVVDDNQDSTVTSSPSKLRRKRQNSLTSTIIKDYLHAESSSDVDLNDAGPSAKLSSSLNGKSPGAIKSSTKVTEDGKDNESERKDGSKEGNNSKSKAKDTEEKTEEANSEGEESFTSVTSHDTLRDQESSQEPDGKTDAEHSGAGVLEVMTCGIGVNETMISVNSETKEGEEEDQGEQEEEEEEDGSLVDELMSTDRSLGGGITSQILSMEGRNFYEGHKDGVRCMLVWGQYLITGSEDGSIRKYLQQSQQLMSVYQAHTGAVLCLHVTTAGKHGARLFTGGQDQHFVTFTFKNFEKITEKKCAAPITCFAESKNTLYIGMGNGSVILYDLKNNINTNAFKLCERGGVTCLATCKEGGRGLLVVGAEDCSISVRDATSSLLLRVLEGHTKPPRAIATKHSQLYSTGDDRTLQIHNINTGDLENMLWLPCPTVAVCVDHQKLAVGGNDGTVTLYSRKTNELECCYLTEDKTPLTSMLLVDSVLYTGDSSGVVQAVAVGSGPLWTCKFGRCSSVFGLRGDLLQHVMLDHTGSSTESAVSVASGETPAATLQCLWLPGCSSLISQSQDTEKHMLQHINDNARTARTDA